MIEVQVSLPSAILFILDPMNTETLVPAYVNGELVASTATCVSVGTQAEVDGETLVVLEKNLAKTPDNLFQVFSGSIASESGRLAIVTSDFESLLESEVSSGLVGVQIWTDDLRSPSKIVVNLIAA